MAEHALPIEIDVGRRVWAVTFSANGKHLLSGDDSGVRVWRVKDAKLVTAMNTVLTVNCLAVSDDGRWIAAGALLGHVFMWATKTYERVWTRKDDSTNIRGVDFSPDSTCLLTASADRTATVWDLADRTKVRTLLHRHGVRAAKYSPQGDRIATATPYTIRIWDNDDGSLLAEINVRVALWHNKGLLWSHGHLFVVSRDAMKKLDPYKGSTVSEWPVPDTNDQSSIALPKHGQFIVYTTNKTITFRDMSSHTPLHGAVQRPRDVHLIALSPDDRLLASCGENGKISLERISDRLSTLQEPIMRVDEATLSSWRLDQLENAEASLTTAIAGSQDPNHDELTCRAFVRARLRKWAAALADAEMAIKIQPSILGYIAQSLAYVGNGEKDKGYQFWDIALAHSNSAHLTFLHLVKAIFMSMIGEHHDAISCMDNIIATVDVNSVCYVAQAYMHLRHGNSQMEIGNYEGAIQSFEHALAQMRPLNQSLSVISLISGWKFDDLDVVIRQRFCEALYLAGRAEDAMNLILELVDVFEKEVYTRPTFVEWVSEFTHKYFIIPNSDAAWSASSSTGMAALRASETQLLKVWVKSTLASRTWRDALLTAAQFVIPRLFVDRAVCEHLEEICRVTDLYECLLEMMNELTKERSRSEVWIVDLKCWCGGKLEDLGDRAMEGRRHNEAIVRYSAAMSLDLPSPQTLLAKRSKARANIGSWEAALSDANEIIALDPSSPLGYEKKQAALRGAGRLADADDAFETMLSKTSESTDPEIRERARKYVRPSEVESAIRMAVRDAIRESPLVLINTDAGRLLNRHEQASSFESQLIYHELVSSMTTNIDGDRIDDAVGKYYRYAMFSHRWEGKELCFKEVMGKIVHELEKAPSHDKLKMFCAIVREAGLHWAWSDTCCINQEDLAVQQESLVSMFKWYQGSTLTIVYLSDVPFQRLVDSAWNSRAWTFQEYHASKVVRFYNKNWMPYKNLDLPNHKECPEIIAEMEEATKISAKALMALQPGLDDIREKLRLASTRQATRLEDTAYSLFGIFSTLLPVQYGEGDQSLGRLLAQLMTSSGDTSILAWTGKSGSFNSCLPAKIVVFKDPPTSHVPPAMSSSELETAIEGMPVNVNSAVKLYDKLHGLPLPLFVGKRLKLSCLTFKLGPLSATRGPSGRAFHAKAEALGTVEIATTEDLSQSNRPLTLVHPWIDFLLDRQPEPRDASAVLGDASDLGSFAFPCDVPPQSRAAWLAARFGLSRRRGRDRGGSSSSTSLEAPPRAPSRTDKRTEALKLVARLRRPFGALLLAQRRQNVLEYERVAAESVVVVVQVQREASLSALVDKAQTVDVL